jgi:taurine-pyruvate aminotransferase
VVTDKKSKEPASDELMTKIIGKCKEKGLIIGRNGDTVPGFNNVIIVAPPLSSTEDDLNFLVETVKYAFNQL